MKVVTMRVESRYDWHNFKDHVLFGVFPTLEAARAAIEKRMGREIEEERPNATDDPRLMIVCGETFIVQEVEMGEDVLPSYLTEGA